MPVETALARLLESIPKPLGSEQVKLENASGRILTTPLTALRTQPPFSASAMDGYAVRASDADVGASLAVIGEVPAGYAYDGVVNEGTCVRIFTGAPVPDGADAILIQEDADRVGDQITVRESVQPGLYIRPAGLDFKTGDPLISAPKTLTYRDLALAASMNHPSVTVRKRPRIALLATGDELVAPGSDPGPEQIIASNGYGLAAMISEAGGDPVDLGIAPDDQKVIAQYIKPALADGLEILVTMGGASVGDHDLIQDTLTEMGMTLDFWRIAMRPGKPLMFGRLNETLVLGLPGNPVSSLVCALVFLRPMINAFLGLEPQSSIRPVTLAATVPPNDRRQDYLRSRIVGHEGGRPIVEPFPKQDSSMLATFTAADALLIRPPHAPEALKGSQASALIL